MKFRVKMLPKEESIVLEVSSMAELLRKLHELRAVASNCAAYYAALTVEEYASLSDNDKQVLGWIPFSLVDTAEELKSWWTVKEE